MKNYISILINKRTMAHITIGERAFLVNKDEYGSKTRTMFKLANSAVLNCDDGTTWGFAGVDAATKLVKASTATDGTNAVHTIPTDFRMAGISVLTTLGVPEETQIKMFSKFMTNCTKEQRDSYVTQYDAVKNDPIAVQQFADAMVALFA